MPIETLSSPLQAAVFVIGIILLVKGADWLVSGASFIATKLGIPKVIVGLTIVAIGTSAPEFAVSGYAALDGSGEIALANVVGSNIFNLGFILALCALITPVQTSKVLVWRDGMVLLAGTILMAIFSFTNSEFSRGEASVMVAGLVSYIGYLIYTVKKHKGSAEDIVEIEEVETEGNFKVASFKLATGLFALLFGCNLVVETAQIFAKAMGLSEWFIGITVIAIGTSLPELVTALTSVYKKDSDIGIGGLIGSDIFNIFGVVGMAALAKPLSVSDESTLPFYFLIFATILTAVFMRTGWRLSRNEGVILLVVASARYAYEIL